MSATKTTRRRKWAAAASAATLVAAGLVLSGSTAAQAFGPAQACTESHPNVGEVPAYTQNADGWPKPVPGYPDGSGGYVYLFYEDVRGYNCAIVISSYGSNYVDVGIRSENEAKAPDTTFSESASQSEPVYIEASDECVQVTAAVGNRSMISDFGNCGA